MTPKEKQRQALLAKREEVTGKEKPVNRPQKTKTCKNDVLVAVVINILDHAYQGDSKNWHRNPVWLALRKDLRETGNWKKSYK